MTNNQIAYGRLVEERRHNQASEVADYIEAVARDRTSLADEAYKSEEMKYLGYDAQTRRITAQAAASQASTRLNELAETIRSNLANERLKSTEQYMRNMIDQQNAFANRTSSEARMKEADAYVSKTESDVSSALVRNVLDVVQDFVPGLRSALRSIAGIESDWQNGYQP